MPVKFGDTSFLDHPEGAVPFDQKENSFFQESKKAIFKAIGEMTLDVMNHGFVFSVIYSAEEWNNFKNLVRLKRVLETLVAVLNGAEFNGQTIPPQEEHGESIGNLIGILRNHGFQFVVVDNITNPEAVVLSILKLFIKKLQDERLLREKIPSPE